MKTLDEMEFARIPSPMIAMLKRAWLIIFRWKYIVIYILIDAYISLHVREMYYPEVPRAQIFKAYITKLIMEIPMIALYYKLLSIFFRVRDKLIYGSISESHDTLIHNRNDTKSSSNS